MADRRFFDTNILVYAFAADDPRSARAETLIAEGGVIGIQVLNEFTNVTRRKLRWDWEQIEASLAVIDELLGTARPLTTALHAQAVVLARDFKLSFYDAQLQWVAEPGEFEIQIGPASDEIRLRDQFSLQ